MPDLSFAIEVDDSRMETKSTIKNILCFDKGSLSKKLLNYTGTEH